MSSSLQDGVYTTHVCQIKAGGMRFLAVDTNKLQPHRYHLYILANNNHLLARMSTC